MISIRECCDNIEEIEKIHTAFIVEKIEPVLDFYIDIFKIKLEINVFTQDRDISNYLRESGSLNAKTKHSLMSSIFELPEAIKRYDDYYNLRFDDQLKVGLNDYNEVKLSLLELKTLLGEIISCKTYNSGIVLRRKIYFISQEISRGIINKVFNYDWFVKLAFSEKWNAYKLTESLGLKVCCYCNRQYTFTVSKDKSKLTRPELDHFLPKSKYPMFALSFYNLIPSCTVCNRDLKGQINFNHTEYFSPYEENVKHSNLYFDYIPLSFDGASGKTDEIEVKLKVAFNIDEATKRRVNGNLGVFKYDEILAHHKDVVQDIIRKRYFSEDNYIQILQNTFPQANLTLEEAYRYAYGNFYDEKDFAKRPLAKLTKDIAINVGSIYTYNESN